MPDPIVMNEPGPFNGPFSANSPLIDAVSAVPYEGLWVPARFNKESSIEISGAGATAIVAQLYGTNAPAWPMNQYNLTVAGTVTANDIVTTTFTNPLLPAGQQSISYSVQNADTPTTIAAALSAMINANAALAAVQIQASSAAAVVSVSYPSFSYQNLSGGQISDPQNIASPSSPMFANTTQMSASKSSGATETLTVTVGTNGTAVGSAITALGLTQLSGVYRWLKLRLTGITGPAGTAISAFLQGVG